MDRRTFVGGAVAASAAVAIPGGAPPAEASQPPTHRTRAGVAWQRVPCRLCGVGCGMLIGVAGGRVVGAKGDPSSPIGEGLACVKGYHAPQSLFGRDRITRPMVRRKGALVPVSPAEAYDLIAARLRETIARSGKQSVGLYGSAQWTMIDGYVAAKLFKGGLGCNNLETSARIHTGSASVAALGTFGIDGAIGGFHDLDHADTIVLWDVDLAETDPVLFSRILARRRRDPAVRLIEMASRTTRTSYAVDRSILCAPHATVAIANAICHEIVRGPGLDRRFVERHLSFYRGRTDFGDGAGPLAERSEQVSLADYLRFLDDYDAASAERHSGVPADTVRWIASLYADPTRKVTSVWGPSVSASTRGTWNNQVLYNIHLLVGKIASAGNGALCLTGQPNGGWATHDAGCRPDGLPSGTVTEPTDRARAAEIWGVPADRIDPSPGLAAIPMFRALDDGALKFLWIQATNPMLSLPDLARYRRAAGQPDRFVVVTDAYPTPTTDVADVVLPAALWLERDGIYINGGRRVQHFTQSVAPPGDAASDAWHMIEVGRRMGLAELFPWNRASLVASVWEEYRRFHSAPATALPALEALAARAGVLWPAVGDREVEWRFRPDADPAADPSVGSIDFYGWPDHRARIWLRPHQPPAERPSERYPYWLGTGPVLEHWGGGALTQRIPPLHRGLPHAYVELNREDAARLGVRDRSRVRVVSARGAIEAEARIDYRSQPPRGSVFVPWFDEGVAVNRLTGDRTCPLSGQPDRSCAVRIERVAGGAS
ncbi:MAG: molybdopterin-dependent oxidoreductase [Gemmatimonadales bacterium]